MGVCQAEGGPPPAAVSQAQGCRNIESCLGPRHPRHFLKLELQGLLILVLLLLLLCLLLLAVKVYEALLVLVLPLVLPLPLPATLHRLRCLPHHKAAAAFVVVRC